jgi:hypothetical protein
VSDFDRIAQHLALWHGYDSAVKAELYSTCLITPDGSYLIDPILLENDLIFDVPPFGRLWYAEPNAVGYAKFFSRSHDAVIRVYDEASNVIDTHEHKGDFKEW